MSHARPLALRTVLKGDAGTDFDGRAPFRDVLGGRNKPHADARNFRED